MRATRYPLWVWLIPALLLSFALAVRLLNADILFVDEYWSIRNSGGTFGPLDISGIWERTATLDPGGMGVLYHWLLSAWMRWVGITPFAIRAFSLLVGMLSIAVTYRLGRDLYSPRVGLVAGLILALSAFFIDYLHEGRAYTLLVLFTVWAVYSYHQSWHSSRFAPLWIISLSLSLSALAYTHYVALAMGLVLGIYHLFHWQKSCRWWAMVVAMAVGGILFLPWLNTTLEVIRRGLIDTNRHANSMQTSEIIETLLHAFSNANIALLLFLAVYALTWQNRHAFLLWLWVIVSIVLVIMVNTVIPFMVHLRYLLFVFPALALIIALGLNRLDKRTSLILLVIWLGMGVYQSLNPRFINGRLFGQIYRAPQAGISQALDTLEHRAEAGDMALFHIIPPGFAPFNYFPLDYYFFESGLLPHDAQGGSVYRYDQFERMNNQDGGGDNVYIEHVYTALADVDAVWTMVIPELETTQRSDVVRFVLDTSFTHCETVLEHPDMQMNLYVRNVGHPMGNFAGEDVALHVQDLGRGFESDIELHVVLGWDIENVPVNTYSVAFHLFDEFGNFVTQHDFALPDRRPFACTGESLPLEGLPPGTYHLRVTVYNRQTGDRLQTTTGDYLDLRTLVIE